MVSAVLQRLAAHAHSVSGVRYAVRPAPHLSHHAPSDASADEAQRSPWRRRWRGSPPSPAEKQAALVRDRYAGPQRLTGPSPRWAAVLAADRTTLRSQTIFLRALVVNCALWAAMYTYLGPSVFGPGFSLGRDGNAFSAVVFLVWSLAKVASWRAFGGWVKTQRRGAASGRSAASGAGADGGPDDAAISRLWWDAAALVNSPSLTVNALLVWTLFILTTTNLALGASDIIQVGTVLVPLFAAVTEGGASFLRWSGVVLSLYVAVALVALNFRDVLREHVPPSADARASLAMNCTSNMLVFVALLQELFARRLRQAEQLASEWSRALQFDLRTPLHALIGAAEQLVTMRGPSKRGGGGGGGGANSVEGKLLSSDECPEREILTLAETARTLFENAALDKFQGPLQRPSSDNNPVPVSLFDLCASISTNLTAIARTRQHAASLTLNGVPLRVVSRDQSPTVQLDNLEQADLLQCVVNLISNSAKFTPDGGHIFVSVEVPSSSGYLVCKVEDTGPGVPPEMRQRVFGRYTRGSDTQSTQGVGLGLSVVHAVLRRSGGSVVCKDRRGDEPGAKFVIRTPCRVLPVGGGSQSMQSSGGDAAAVAESSVFVGDVCIVDDNAMNLRILRRLLLRSGVPDASVSAFTSSEDCLEHVSAEGAHFDIALLDCVLPGMDGVELTRRLLDLHDGRLQVFGLSASASADEFIGAGACGFFRKPFSMVEIRQALGVAVSPASLPSRSSSSSNVLPNAPAKGGPATQQPFPSLVVDVMHVAGFVALGSAGLCALFGYWFLAAVYLFFGTLLVVADPASRLAGCYVAGWSLGCACVGATLMGIFGGCQPRISMVPVLLAAQHMPRRFLWIGASFVGVALSWALINFDPDRSGVCATRLAWTQEEFLLMDASILVCVLAVFVVQLSFVGFSLERQEWFTHTLSHDIRAPLHGILALLGDVERNPAREKHIQAIESMAVVLSSTVDTVLLLDDDRTNAGTLSEESRTVSISELARFVKMQLSLVLEQKCDTAGLFGHRVAIDVPRAEVFFVLARLVMVAPLQRSISGIAAKFVFDREAGNLTLELSGTAHANMREGFEGKPMPSLTEKVESSLLLSNEIARLAGSALEVEEQAAGKWMLRFTLAVDNFSVANDSAPPPAFPQIARVAVIDDNGLHRQIAARLCAQLGLENVHLFGSADDFCDSELSVTTVPGVYLFLVDMHMPGISGPASWRERCPEMFQGDGRVALACCGDSSVAQTCREAGFRGYLCKPFSLADLRDCISSAVEGLPSQ
jgi:signal transduction histidine kinase/CheY-like chemotaxis protein